MNDYAVIVSGGGAHGEAVHSACEAAAKAELTLRSLGPTSWSRTTRTPAG